MGGVSFFYKMYCFSPVVNTHLRPDMNDMANCNHPKTSGCYTASTTYTTTNAVTSVRDETQVTYCEHGDKKCGVASRRDVTGTPAVFIASEHDSNATRGTSLASSQVTSVHSTTNDDDDDDDEDNLEDADFVHEEGCSCENSDCDDDCDDDGDDDDDDDYDDDDDDNDETDSHEPIYCTDPSCCDPALAYYSEDDISSYRDRGMSFEDRGDGTGFWYNAGPCMSFGRGTGVVFDDDDDPEISKK